VPDVPLRSVLYVPADRGRAIARARELPVDGLILDLEDAVAPDAKLPARQSACAAVSSGDYPGRVLAVRINGIGTPWHEEDLAAVARAGPDAVVVPKVGSAAEIEDLERRLERLGAPRRTAVWATLETPAAVLRSAEIAAAGQRLSVLVMGSNDLRVGLGAPQSDDRGPLEVSLTLCLLAARAAGRVILDGVYNHVRDPAGLEADCLAAWRLGFDGKTLIHPDQIEICQRVFTPTDEELAQARRVLEAFAATQRTGAGVAVLDGRLIEQLHVDAARRLLERARPASPSR
jgi:citrate lyase subunit beta/citryl-CoA lyase